MTVKPPEGETCVQRVPSVSSRFCTNPPTHRVVVSNYGIDLGWVCDEHWQDLIDAGLVGDDEQIATA